MKFQNKKLVIVIGIGVVILISILLFFRKEILGFCSMANIKKVASWINGFGFIGIIVYIFIFAASTVLFLPSLPFTLLGGITYGTLWGIIYASLGDILGTIIAFCIARYSGREWVYNKLKKNKVFHYVNDGVKEQGWRIVIITRFVPLFPHSVQNYAYGLTPISFWTYIIVTYLSLLPGTIVWIMAINAVGRAAMDPKKMIIYISIFAVLLALLSYVPKWLYKKKYSKG